MSADIQFGELEHSQPDEGVRPDRDAHFAVFPVGGIGMPDSETDPGDDLLIFVDLDVMRDMEAHALSDTRVELGGVMLGQQRVDSDGRPYVIITDCLRAEHYKATKGSFTFTHDTWSQITAQRKQHHPDLEMIGWYHTHPGWTVFLSGMDLFICNNFFNKPLDVALVIDPVNDDRGWFQWTEGPRPVTRPTKGFYLISNKYRQSELKYFSRLYSNGPDMNDPRYSESSFGGGSPVVNLTESRNPMMDLAILAMLTVQFAILALLAWKMMTPPAVAKVEAEEMPAAVEQARDQAYRDILKAAVSANGQSDSLVEQYTQLKTENARLLANMDGQMARAEKFAAETDRTKLALAANSKKASKLEENVKKKEIENTELKEELAKFKKTANGEEASGEQGMWGYLWYLVGALALFGSSAAAFLIGNRKGKMEAFEYEDNFGRAPGDSPANDDAVSSESTSETSSDSERIHFSMGSDDNN